MPRNLFFRVFTESFQCGHDHDRDEDSEWSGSEESCTDETVDDSSTEPPLVVARTHLCSGDGAASDSACSSRALCPDCSCPLRRVAKLPFTESCLVFGRVKECVKCEHGILPGELHFTCRNADCASVLICRSCGPGVYIERTFDYFSKTTGPETLSRPVPGRLVHRRSARRLRDDQDNRTKRRGSKVASGSVSGVVPRKRSAGAESASVCAVAADMQPVAHEILKRTMDLINHIDEESHDVLDCNWGDATGPGVMLRLLGTTCLREAAAAVVQLANAVQTVFALQPPLGDMSAPCKVYGDIHGQLRDVLQLFAAYGVPGSPECPRAIFNGDFVDRGQHSLEVVIVLFALKLVYPADVWLNRGNHEDDTMNQKYGFQGNCAIKLGQDLFVPVYTAILAAFDYMPFACRVAKKVLILHGGIGDGKWHVDDIMRVQRPVSSEQLRKPNNIWLWNILWSDPIEDDSGVRANFGIHRSPRGPASVRFGWNVTQRFCATNGLDLIVRSHQAKRAGYGFEIMHNELLARVFSARDYEGNGNDGAILYFHYTMKDGKSGTDSRKARGLHMLTVRAQVLGSIAKGLV